ncbi:unnamed protein product [Spirodela intermedia]|uniref:HD domain-containing protein n=1 Tax=Spirodela intermedia TaxID=51605 RepID=A0A7I8JPY3_SPIIN|nr:unnamed protein product [Spirodela intermedia]CAA6672227.1 unnamed protein product [Spirodela intermedia]
MGAGRGAVSALISWSSSSSLIHHPFVLSPHLTFRPLLPLRHLRGRGASVRMASDSGAPQKECSAAAAASSLGTSSAPAGSMSSASSASSSAVDFLTLCHRLKGRVGDSGVRDPESVADHMYRMSVMALISAELPGVDRERLGSSIVGDITPSDGVPKLEKSRREREALDHMCTLLGDRSRAKEIHELWMEYEENSSLEAKLVKDFDKVEMILQALEYETEQGKDLEEFFQSTSGKFQTELGKAWASEIASRRRKKE